MKQRLNVYAALAAAWMCLGLSACHTLRRPEPPAVSPVEPAPPVVEATPPPIDNTETASTGDAPADAGTPPPCTCMEAKAKPKVKPKPKPVHKEAPPQLPTAPVVVETRPGGVIDAQVRPMNVSVMSILGKRVQGADGEDLGRVVDVLADNSGRVRIAIVDFGGFLGVGDRRIAVDWPLLRFNPDGRDPSLILSISRDKLKAAPEYKDNPRPQTLMEPTAAPASAPVTPAAESRK